MRDQIQTFCLCRYTVLIKCSVATMQTSVLISHSFLACLCLLHTCPELIEPQVGFCLHVLFQMVELFRAPEVRVTEASYIDLFVVLLLISCVLFFTNITLSYKKEGEDAMGRENEEYTPFPPACRVTRTPCGMLYFDIFINMSYY